MTALAAAAAAIYPARLKKDFVLNVAADAVIYPGAKCAVLNGYLRPVDETPGLKHFCTATNKATVDNTGGSNGDLTCSVEFDDVKTLMVCVNDGTAPLTSAHIGRDAYAVDDSGVVSADGTGRSRLGTPWLIIGSSDGIGQRPGVYVEVDGVSNNVSNVATLQFAAPTELTIDAGEIEVVQAVHTVDTESDASSDNLDAISGSVANQLYLIRPANAARTVVIRDASVSSGNIFTPHKYAISLAESTDWALLISDGTNLTVLAASVKASDSVPYMQTADATLASGTATVNTGIVVASTSVVFAFPKGAITGSTNFATVRELLASRVNGAAGVGTVVIEAITNGGVLDADAAGAVQVVILTPQS